ncbi:hypothetical protein AMATHDRAFT_68852 [Amanita thiersii Skay4041]|uniref:Protein kinase domain-containing protein n=1 Tax=Amanita thiersii Skay4041 TaxID=703135 RepID=A0A2A9N9Y2_9AGAR|nr:hypothetical protein AMATHDRAFT_68852 [Amanita thiersii Skay4041]
MAVLLLPGAISLPTSEDVHKRLLRCCNHIEYVSLRAKRTDVFGVDSDIMVKMVILCGNHSESNQGILNETAKQLHKPLIISQKYISRCFTHTISSPLLDSHTRVARTVLVEPFYKNGNVLQYLKGLDSSDLGVARRMTEQLATGMYHLHARNVVHGKLHLGNILVDNDGNILISDVELEARATKIPQLASSQRITFCRHVDFTKPPEHLRALETNEGLFSPQKSTDVYTFACCVFSIHTRKHLKDAFSGKFSEWVIQCSELGASPFVRWPEDMPQDIKTCLEMCWNIDPERRPSMDDILHMLSVPLV